MKNHQAKHIITSACLTMTIVSVSIFLVIWKINGFHSAIEAGVTIGTLWLAYITWYSIHSNRELRNSEFLYTQIEKNFDVALCRFKSGAYFESICLLERFIEISPQITDYACKIAYCSKYRDTSYLIFLESIKITSDTNAPNYWLDSVRNPFWMLRGTIAGLSLIRFINNLHMVEDMRTNHLNINSKEFSLYFSPINIGDLKKEEYEFIKSEKMKKLKHLIIIHNNH